MRFLDSKYSHSEVKNLCLCLASNTISYEHSCHAGFHVLLTYMNLTYLGVFNKFIIFHHFGGNDITIYGDEICKFYHECPMN